MMSLVTSEGVKAASATSLRERIIEAASDLTIEQGWSGVTMSRLAERVGVSRQTIYNEVGNKPDLAESLVLWELGHFLEAVNAGFDAHPDDLIAAAREAIRRVLERASVNPLLRAAISATEGTDTGLLPLLTTDSESLAAAAAVVIELRLGGYEHHIEPHRLGALVDMIVRLVVSHVIRASGTPEESSGHIAWIIEQALRPDRS
ncbi:possible transcriptional regulatory protein (probably tetr-family protein) [Janibacter sp. HTCC2649]|nr:possible transcriptional regulatory protein (probably tetr-family protein) [Janibacter sp. HTCC2649]